ncbi:MAG: VacB/RNase II family 3'-5' exoribonuclease [Pleurocapsa sp. SU_5_0]|nr:VacB/RNase II family 3'-5' exoribonuclease [Pleurocapsa sp. SU_5_0]NJO96299.1 VacB/RNase II family 3'-5' exoribonuclease [Pleurocapsa sp. CRU_1_2]NJR46045.1 VacB/RNase II family 3'-5' exoribonuclease [Hyellaceae cyanobacterium CSU_1_1]
MEQGKLIELRVQGERRLAVAERPEGKKDWIVIDAGGQSHKIRPQRVDYAVEGTYESADIKGFLAEVESYLDPSSLEIAWEMLIEDNETVTPQQMAELLFSEQSPVACYAAHVLLSQDKVYFKQKSEHYEPRPAAQVEEIKHQLEVQAEKEQEKQQFIVHLQQALAGEKIQWTESDRLRLEAIEKLALDSNHTSKLAQEILQSTGRHFDAQGAWQLLVDLGWWSRHENLFLRRSSYPITFSKKVLDVVQPRLQFDSAEANDNRLDLTHLKVCTIDDESTTEIDDGLSVEYLEDGRAKIWVHIADPTRLVDPEDELDLEARRRSTSLYLPTGMIPMFPPELATGPMSLVEGKICSALSFGVILDESGGIQEYEIHPSLIKPTYRLTYDDVDEMLQLGVQNEPEIADLARISYLRRSWRKDQGAIQIKMPESVIKVRDEEVTIELIDSSPSRQLVAEMMILAGQIGGKYGTENILPLPYRGQPQPELPPEEELLQLPAGPTRFCAIRSCMPRSEMSMSPIRHASLGLESYVQVTSPIRRYTDLLSHFQIKAHLKGEELPFSREELQEIVYSVSSSSYEATLVERQTNRYWGLEYLRRNSKCVWDVVVLRWLRQDEDLGLILIEDLGMELPHRFDRPVALGERMEMQVTHADPQRDEVRLREITEAEIQATSS